MIAALLAYVTHAYPRALGLCRALGPAADYVLSGQTVPASEPSILEMLDIYSQHDERDAMHSNEYPAR